MPDNDLSQSLSSRFERIDRLNASMQRESDRGKACVGDGVIDELVKELFEKRLLDRKTDVDSLLSGTGPLGNHGARLRLAYCLGWIGPETHRECQTIRRIRNQMAHRLDVDSFDHEQVRDLVDSLKSRASELSLTRGSKMWFAVMISIARIARFIEESERAQEVADLVPLSGVKTFTAGPDPGA